jgi:RNA polymerase sigma-70 factor (ECF subfamily)
VSQRVDSGRISERELVERARREPEAFAELYRRYGESVRCYALGQLRNPADAEDLTSEVFARALAAIGRYRDTGAPFRSWLLRIAAHAIADHRRRARHRQHDDLDQHLDDLTAEGSLEDLVVARDRVRQIVRATRLLPESQRTVLALRYGQDLPMAAVAERIGRTEAAARLLRHRAVARLRASVLERAS